MMTGHTPIRLFLTSGLQPAISAIQTLQETLVRNSLAEWRSVSSASGHTEHAWGKTLVGGKQVSIEIDFLPDPGKPGLICPVILLHSEAYEAVVDLLERRVRPSAKEDLIQFCLDASGAIQAEGFRLEFANDESITPLVIDRLVTNLTSGSSTCLLAGIATTSPSLARVKAVWPVATERSGYFVLDFI